MTGAGRVLSSFAALVYAMILSPIVVVVMLSFSADNFILFPPSGYSLRWFQQLAGNGPLLAALWLSVQVAAVVTLLSLAVGVPAALALAKGRFAGKEALTSFFLAPLLLPTLITGLALLLFFSPLKLTATLPGLVLGDTSAVAPVTATEFRTAGLTHLTAVSGANVSIVCAAVLLSARFIGPRPAVGLAALALLAFVTVAVETSRTP